MANFTEIKYFIAGYKNETYTLLKSVYDNPHTAYINLNNVESVFPIKYDDFIPVKLDDDTTIYVKDNYFWVYMTSTMFFMVPSYEFSKFINTNVGI